MNEITIEFIASDLWSPGQARRMTVPFDRLTPSAAREILYHAVEERMALSPEGAVWWPEGGYGYRVYQHSTAKLYKRWKDED